MLEAVDTKLVRQGDIVRGLFFPVFDKPQFDFIPTNAGKSARIRRNAPPEADPAADERALVKVLRTPALILSQTCDLARGEFALIAPLQPVQKSVSIRRVIEGGKEERVRWDKALPNEVERERARIASQEAYLGLFPVFKSDAFGIPEDLVADFRRCSSLAINKPAAKQYLLEHRLASLTHDARSVLQHKLANFFGRYAAADGWHETPDGS